MSPNIEILLIYLIIINVASAAVCIYDKIMAIENKKRIRESMLIWLSILGGSVFMLITMKIIRHKTLHAKFMIGIPVIIFLQVVLAWLFIFDIDKII